MFSFATGDEVNCPIDKFYLFETAEQNSAVKEEGAFADVKFTMSADT